MLGRIVLTLVYAIALGAMAALDNLDDLNLFVGLGIFALAPVIGFLVGRTWVALAILGYFAGRPIGWDPSENDGASALYMPYVLTSAVFLALPLWLGVAVAIERERRQLAKPPPPAP